MILSLETDKKPYLCLNKINLHTTKSLVWTSIQYSKFGAIQALILQVYNSPIRNTWMSPHRDLTKATQPNIILQWVILWHFCLLCTLYRFTICRWYLFHSWQSIWVPGPGLMIFKLHETWNYSDIFQLHDGYHQGSCLLTTERRVYCSTWADPRLNVRYAVHWQWRLQETYWVVI